MKYRPNSLRALTGFALCATAGLAFAQQPAASAAPETCLQTGIIQGPATYRSVEVLADRRVTFRVCAPAATEAWVTSNDVADVIPMGRGVIGLPMTRDAKGLWSVTTDKRVREQLTNEVPISCQSFTNE